MTKYRLNLAGFREHLLNAEFMVAEMRARADRGREFAEADAPEATGEFKASFSASAGRHGGIHGDRAEGVLSSSDPEAMPKEFGHTAKDGRHIEGAYTMTKALDVMGG